VTSCSLVEIYRLFGRSVHKFLQLYMMLDPRERSHMVTRLRVGRSGFRFPVGPRIFSSPNRSDRLWDPPSLLFNRYQGSCPGVKWPGRDVNHSPLSRGEVKERLELYLYSPCILMAWTGTHLFTLSHDVTTSRERL
jgi:hypothetical protein